MPPGRHWLDVGCGTGALTSTILTNADPVRVTGVDRSAGFVASARARIADGRSAFQVGDARALPFSDRTVDVVVSGLALNVTTLAEPARAALRELLVARLPVEPDGSIRLTARAWGSGHRTAVTASAGGPFFAGPVAELDSGASSRWLTCGFIACRRWDGGRRGR
ncbi:class I SAM-dependent methyltransferase [Micromonospora coriariae]|uniref:class I SAM-dependent methyltransferase n=1 Tax=Micromonospora coriariae TaxID=285665 RepID=UPI001E556B27|nr:class I SAM-dependent methyltransferase [Micromonospora coriariae]